ncbi:MAG: hypothetical protein LBD75_04300 [Candidatus Peribacteria bacterium]|jgi:hypothetical protein|nr:hypothetical protein [Candidatus Peribacteria bacterium]
MKNRKIDKITPGMLKRFYADPIESLVGYVGGMTEAIEKARFLGKSAKGNIKSIGEFVNNEGIKGKDADTLIELLQSRFNTTSMPKFFTLLKTIGNNIHL